MMRSLPLDEINKYDRQLNISVSKNFLGHARVKLSSLDFRDGREVDDRIVQKLVELFQDTQCRRYDPDNYIKVSVSKKQLRSALRRSRLTQNALKSTSQDGNFPFLYTRSTQNFTCYDGQHRTKAAECFFNNSDDHWWTVELYLKEPEGM
jgi:hypothetical protein